MNLIIQLFQIATLRRKPADIPYLPVAAAVAFLAYVATSVFQMQVTKNMPQPEQFAIIQAAAQAVIYYLLLKINNKEGRYVQMTTAIFGISSILQFISLAMLRVPALQFFAVAASVWNMVLLIIILRETLECKTPTAILLTIFYHFVIGLVLMMTFPEFFKEMQEAMLKTK